ncbi:MAG TPA: hypothetical protein VMZ52_10575 [Bryobacteraceae bacterium]|nr:hypothetical protein [Bryobacteraceae bacterium]
MLEFLEKNWEKLLAYFSGILFITVMLVLSLVVGNPTPSQFFTFRLVLALAAAGFGAVIPGFISVNVSNVVRAGGAIALFVIVFLLNPPALVATASPWKTPEEQTVTDLRWQISDLSRDFETIDRYPNAASEVRKNARRLAEAILSYPESKLYDPTRRWVRHCSAAHAFLMSARLEPAGDKARADALRALTELDLALKFLEQAKAKVNDPANGAAARYIVDWVAKNDQDNRAYYLMAIGECVLAQAENDSARRLRSRTTLLEHVDTQYLKDYLPWNSQGLDWCVPRDDKEFTRVLTAVR